tara:strand:+ start:1928 stop:3163 length:1236 start_codon:yes stop_codon:yes gene_type:complete
MVIRKLKYWKHPSKTNFIFLEKKESPLISIDIWFKAGNSFEKKGKEGSAHFLEHMIFKGNDKLRPGEFDLKIESLGGTSNASTGHDDVHYYVLVPTINFQESFELLLELVLNPKFDLFEFNKEKKVILEEIMQQEDQIDENLFNLFLKKAWNNHSYGKSILGLEKNIKNIDIDDLRSFHKKQYSSINSAVAISGNLPPNILEICKNIKINYPNNGNFKHKRYAPHLKNAREEIFIERLEFSRIFMAWQIPNARYQKLLLGFELLTSILTDGKNSRLIKPLQEEANLVESIQVEINTGEIGSLFILEACCISENLKLVEYKINKIMDDIKNSKPLLKKEIKKAIRIIKSEYIFNLETTSQLTSYYGNHLLWGRLNPIIELNKNLLYWNNLENFEQLLTFFECQKFTLIAHAK